jgi:hypothetical protein
MKKSSLAGVLLAMIASTAGAAAEPAATAADYARFLGYWPGVYDNLAQVAGQTGATRNQATRLYIRRVEAPAFGADVYYAEWQDAADPAKVTRQRIYAFSREPSGELRLALHIFSPENKALVARTIGAHEDPRKLDGVTPADMAGLKGCDVFFRPDGAGFSGAMIKGDCAFPAPDGTPIYSWSQMKLNADTFSYLDGWFRTDGTLFQRMSPDWYVFRKATP